MEERNKENNLEELPGNYKVKKELGEGSYGTVYLATDLKTQTNVAIKVFRYIYRNPVNWKHVMREVEIVAKLKSHYNISLIEVILRQDDLYIVMDYMEYDLRKFLQMPVFLHAPQVKLIMYNIFCGLEYLHSCQVIHRDIKPGNILISKDYSTKICDYSLSRSISGLKAEKYDFSIWLRSSSINMTDEIQLADSLNELGTQGSGIFSSISRLQSMIFEETENLHMSNKLAYEPEFLSPILLETMGKIGELECEIEERKDKRRHNDSEDEKEFDEGDICIEHFALQKGEGGGSMHHMHRKSNVVKEWRRSTISTAHLDKLIKEPLEMENINYKLLAENLKESYKVNEAQMRKNTKKLKRNELEFEERMDNELVRELSNNVVTRYYRPIEIILLEPLYTSSVDIWGAGCIFAEILGMMEDNQPNHSKRRPLFPGKSCFPLSPDLDTMKEHSITTTNTDQLNLIFQLLGTPQPHAYSFLTDNKAKEYISGFPDYPGVDFAQKFPGAEKEALKLLMKTLELNPFKRITAKEALRHKYFEDMRDRNAEETLAPITLLVDAIPDYSANIREYTQSILSQLNLV